MKVIDDLANSNLIKKEGGVLFVRERLLAMELGYHKVTGIKACRVLFNRDLKDFMFTSSLDVCADDNVPPGTFYYEVRFLDEFEGDYVREVSSSCRRKIKMN